MAVTLLAIAGSARKGGNTDALLDWCVEAAQAEGAEVVRFPLYDLDLRGCRACDACFKDGHCIQKDDMQQLYPHLRNADSIVVSAPVYSMGMPGVPKIMIDRCQPFWALKYVLNQPLGDPAGPQRLGAFLSCAGTTFTHVFEGSQRTIRYL
jgi:multimeric flavodoxin WrbA